jgi:hypothetical protein
MAEPAEPCQPALVFVMLRADVGCDRGKTRVLMGQEGPSRGERWRTQGRHHHGQTLQQRSAAEREEFGQESRSANYSNRCFQIRDSNNINTKQPDTAAVQLGQRAIQSSRWGANGREDPNQGFAQRKSLLLEVTRSG